MSNANQIYAVRLSRCLQLLRSKKVQRDSLTLQNDHYFQQNNVQNVDLQSQVNILKAQIQIVFSYLSAQYPLVLGTYADGFNQIRPGTLVVQGQTYNYAIPVGLIVTEMMNMEQSVFDTHISSASLTLLIMMDVRVLKALYGDQPAYDAAIASATPIQPALGGNVLRINI